MHYDYLVIGGGIAGVTAAETIRRKDSAGSIGILSREEGPLYSRVLLPGYVRGKIEREKVYLRKRDYYYKMNIDLLEGVSAITINFDSQKVHTSGSDNVTYGKILVSAGGAVNKWSVPGADSKRIIRLQTIEDGDRARELIGDGGEGLILGGGFISLEFIESAVHYKQKVNCIIRDRQFFGEALDKTGWDILNANLNHHGVMTWSEEEITRVEESEGGLTATTQSGQVLQCQWLGVGIGIIRNIGIFSGAGIDVNKGIVVNEFLRSTNKNAYAAGDIAEYLDLNYDEHRLVGNWTNAFLQGRVAGENMVVKSDDDLIPYKAITTYSIASLGYHLTFVGRCELREGMDDIVRVWDKPGDYERLFFEGGVLKGAILFNRFIDKIPLTKLIELQVDLTDHKEALKDPNYNVSDIS
jgi:nitrite reductase (NADH) large subunit